MRSPPRPSRQEPATEMMTRARDETPGRSRCALATMACAVLLVACVTRAEAAGCNFEIQGEGRVAAVNDARSFRLDDGREVKLAGIEIADKAKASAALSTLLVGREVALRGSNDAPDRYGRQPAYVFL